MPSVQGSQMLSGCGTSGREAKQCWEYKLEVSDAMRELGEDVGDRDVLDKLA